MLDPTTKSQHKMNCNQLLPTVIDDRAKSDPDGAFTKVPILNSYENGYRIVTNADLATAVDYVAGLINSEFGQSSDHECIAYLGLSDLRYIIVLLAGIKTGFKLFFPSPRNSEEAQLSLLAGLSCSKLITTDPNPAGTSLIERVMAGKLTIPSLDAVINLDPSQVTQWPYNKSFEQTRSSPIFVLHTSGSTGIPKPLTYTHEYISRVWHVQTLEPPEGFTSVDALVRKGSYLVSLPPFHIAGFTLAIIFPAMYGCVPVYPIAGIPPTLNSFLDALRSTSFDWTFLSPVVIDEIGRDPKVLEHVAQRLDYLLFSGGSVPQETGSIVARKMTLLQSLGSSECSAIPLIQSKSEWSTEDWAYLQLHPEANAEFQHRFDDCYELVHLRRRDVDAHGLGERFQPVFSMFPGTDSFETKDLFVKHPTSPDLFRHVGRLDDIIVFINGEKTNPVTFEAEVAKHATVRAALLVGQLREEASLLVEPIDLDLSEQAKRDLIEEIWPTIEDSNKRCPKHAKVSKARVLIASKDMPFLRAVKGTVQRQATLTLYTDIIDQFYAEDVLGEHATSVDTIASPQPTSEDEVTTALREIAQGLNNNVVSDDINFFAVGIDSLQVIQFRRALVTRFPLLPITARTIYSNPTVKKLAASITKIFAQDSTPPAPVDEVANMLHSYQSKLDALLQEGESTPGNASSGGVSSSVGGSYSAEAQALSFPITNLASQEVGSILLTGSTGALGSHLLNLLLESGSRRIHCLNRSADSRSLQTARNESRGLPTTFPDDRVTFLSGNLALQNFGLSASELTDLQESVTHVIHSAWPVNFNSSLQSYAETLDGVLGLVRFAHRSNRKVKLQLVSSIGSVARFSQAPAVPETVILDTKVPSSTGYGQSKYIAERILAYASEKLGITTISARVGQITGNASRKRGWNVQEWFPSLVISSLHLGALPDTLGRADNNENLRWISVESVARILLEMSDPPTSATETNTTFHILHPESSSWTTIIHKVKESLDPLSCERGGPPVEVIPYSKWLAKLKTDSTDNSNDANAVTANPAVKLLPFFENLLSGDDFKSPYELTQSLASSSTLRTLPPPLDKDCLQAWIKGWIKETGI